MSVADNQRVWGADERGRYEVWYVTWNHPGTDQGFWLRYITEYPLEGEPRAELWFARFDPRDPKKTFGIHRHLPYATLATSADPFSVKIGACELRDDRAKGELAGDGHAVRWDLRWEPSATTMRHLPDVMYARRGLGESTVLSPNWRVPLSGTLVVDGETLSFDRAIAGQTHVWGKKHAFSWMWARCAEFEGAPDASLEFLGVKLRRGKVTLPPMTLVALDLDGQQHRFTQYKNVLVNRGTWGSCKAAFSAWSPTLRVQGELTCAPEQMVNAPYVDPDGQELYCANTEIGDARVTIYRRSGVKWVEQRVLVGRRRAHFEIGGRERDPAIETPHVLLR